MWGYPTPADRRAPLPMIYRFCRRDISDFGGEAGIRNMTHMSLIYAILPYLSLRRAPVSAPAETQTESLFFGGDDVPAMRQ